MKAEFDIMFGKGISRSGEVLDLAVEHDIIKKSGAWFSYNGSKLGQGRDAVKAMIEDNPELMEEIGEQVRKKLEENRDAIRSGKGAAAGKTIAMTAGEDSDNHYSDDPATGTDSEDIDDFFADDEIDID